jgi:hypothetical protein
MKCKCGNELGKPRVKPFPVSFIDVKTKEEQKILYMGGFETSGDEPVCWFCVFTSRGT